MISTKYVDVTLSPLARATARQHVNVNVRLSRSKIKVYQNHLLSDLKGETFRLCDPRLLSTAPQKLPTLTDPPTLVITKTLNLLPQFVLLLILMKRTLAVVIPYARFIHLSDFTHRKYYLFHSTRNAFPLQCVCYNATGQRFMLWSWLRSSFILKLVSTCHFQQYAMITNFVSLLCSNWILITLTTCSSWKSGCPHIATSRLIQY